MAYDFSDGSDVYTQTVASGPTYDPVFSWFAEFLYDVAQENLYPQLFLHQWGAQIPLPANRGKKVYVPYFATPDANLVGTLPVGDEEPNSPQVYRLDMDYYSGTVVGYGGSFGFTDFFMAIEELPGVLEAGVRQLSQKLALQYETVIQTTLETAYTGGNALYVGGSGKSADPADNLVTGSDILEVPDIVRMEERLGTANAFTFDDGTFKLVIHPKGKYDLFTNLDTAKVDLTQWLATQGGQEKYRTGMVGVINRCEVFVSTDNAPLFTGNGTNNGGFATEFVARGWGISPGAYAVIDLQGMTPNVIIQPFGSAGTLDPLKRNMTVGIKGYFTCVAMDTASRLVGLTYGYT